MISTMNDRKVEEKGAGEAEKPPEPSTKKPFKARILDGNKKYAGTGFGFIGNQGRSDPAKSPKKPD